MTVLKKLLVNLLILTISTVIALGMAEFIVRKAKLSKTWSSYLDGRVLMDAKTLRGGRTGYTRVPDSTFTSARDIVFTTNNFGFRERKIPAEKRGKRIAFIGDSVTEGFGVDTDNRFSNMVEKLLNYKGAESEIYNFAVSGHSTIDQMKVMDKYVLQTNPDIVFLQMCFNDFRRNFDMLKPESEIKAATENQDPFTIKGFLQKNSALYLLFAEKYNYYKLKSGVPNELVPTDSSIPQEEWNLTVEYLDYIHEACSSRNIPMAIAYVPLEVEVMIADASKAEMTNRMIREYCQNKGITFIEIMESLRSSKSGSVDKLYLDDCHLSPEGNRIVAEQIASGLLPVVQQR